MPSYYFVTLIAVLIHIGWAMVHLQMFQIGDVPDSQALWHMPVIPAFGGGGQRQADLCDFEVQPSLQIKSRTAKAIQRNSVLKKKKKKKRCFRNCLELFPNYLNVRTGKLKKKKSNSRLFRMILFRYISV